MILQAIRLKSAAIALVMLMLPMLAVAGEQQAKHDETPLAYIDGTDVSDSSLSSMRGLGDEGMPIVIPEQMSVILWDEAGTGDRSTKHSIDSGKGNTQRVNLRMMKY